MSVLFYQDEPTHRGTTKRARRSAVLILTGLGLVSRTNSQSPAPCPTSESAGLNSILGFLPIILIFAVVGLVWWLSSRRNRGSIDRYLADRAKKLGAAVVPPMSVGTPAESDSEVRPPASPASPAPARATSPAKPATAPELRPYDVNAPCPACGVTGAKSRYKKAGGYDPVARKSYDVMLRNCGNCGYKWRERPLGDQTQKV